MPIRATTSPARNSKPSGHGIKNRLRAVFLLLSRLHHLPANLYRSSCSLVGAKPNSHSMRCCKSVERYTRHSALRIRHFGRQMPCVTPGMPSARPGMTDAGTETPDVRAGMPGASTDMPGVKAETPSVRPETPGAKGEMPGVRREMVDFCTISTRAQN